MAVYYVASKLSFVACKSRCISQRRRQRHSTTDEQEVNSHEEDESRLRNKEQLTTMGFLKSNTITRTFHQVPEVDCEHGTTTGETTKCLIFDDSAVATNCNQIEADFHGTILNAPIETLISLLIPRSGFEIDQNFVFSFLLSSRIFIQPHDLLGKLIESVPENDESLERLVVLMKEWTKRFPYDFRGEEIMSLVKHIVSRCDANTDLGDKMSEMLSALLIKLTELSQHEEEMKSYKKSLDDEQIIEWPSSSKLAQMLCHVEKKFAKHIGPEEFVQCSQNLIKEQSNYDVPAASTTFPPLTEMKKKTCNLENYFEWSNKLRVLVANEILQCSSQCDRAAKIELWSSVAQHCLLVGNYNSATSILEPICRLQAVWKRFMSLSNQQQLDCLLKHMENSQNLNLWSKQTESSSNGIQINTKTQKQVQIVTPHSFVERTFEPSITKALQHRPKMEWVVLPVFVDIVKLALKAREDCSTRLPNGSINFCAFNELAAIVSAFTIHMSNVAIASSENKGDFDYLVNHILTCQLRDENELFAAFEKEASKIESYYDVP